MRCGDCKHWGAGRPNPRDSEGYATCYRIAEEADRVPGDVAYTYGTAGADMTGLLTSPDFGCVLFEKREG